MDERVHNPRPTIIIFFSNMICYINGLTWVDPYEVHTLQFTCMIKKVTNSVIGTIQKEHDYQLIGLGFYKCQIKEQNLK